ncbi:ankyrin repeat domain protein [Candidatus Rickettsiella viridis]|uniref:Ankyrin repeat domain protein n=1 Tax=Candidatus Rickettsiella viridis TaxID=676208 RepID=A0A2Z5UUL3_9COXI|nr:ankyrin repeat domain-containing protein [Candidatus Rickettsiella viridis]BBB15178.1 ankyrin repeat domain protein [Candidatus Rickettsiella viridis]
MPTIKYQQQTKTTDSGYSSNNSSFKNIYSNEKSKTTALLRLQSDIKLGIYSTLKYTLKKGNLTQKDLDSGLIFALENGYTDKKTLKLLLKNGAKPQEKDQINILRLLIEGNHIGMFKKLLDHRYGVFKQENLNRSLHLAAKHGRTEMIKLLLKRADLSYKDEKGNTPLHTAIRYAQKETVNFLLEQAPKTQLIVNNKGNLPLHEAISRGNLDLSKQLLKSIKKHESKIFDWIKPSFFSKKAKPDTMSKTTPNGDTALHLAAKSGNYQLYCYVLNESKPEMVERKNTQGLTALQIITLTQQAFESMLTTKSRPTGTSKAEPIYQNIADNRNTHSLRR